MEDNISDIETDLGGLRFGVDGEGSGGYFKGDGTFVPFKRLDSATLEFVGNKSNYSSAGCSSSYTFTATKRCLGIFYGVGYGGNTASYPNNSQTSCNIKVGTPTLLFTYNSKFLTDCLRRISVYLMNEGDSIEVTAYSYAGRNWVDAFSLEL